MPNSKSDLLLTRGVWCLIVGVLTSWLLGLGLLFILVAAICGFVGLFRQRVISSLGLLMASLVLGFVCAHVAAVSGIYALNTIHARSSSVPAHSIADHGGHRQ